MDKKAEPQVKQEIIEVYNQICQSFSEFNIDKTLSYFSDSDNMIKISNGKMFKGKEELSKYWIKSFASMNELNISIENVETYSIDDNHVWTTAEETISSGDQVKKAIVTNIFVSTSDGWKILLDHTTYL